LPVRGDEVPGNHSVVRYASPRFVDDDLVDGGAFQLRVIDEGELSINDIGPDEPGRAKALATVRGLSRVTLRRNGRFAQLLASDISGALDDLAYLANLAVIYDPLEPEGAAGADVSHAVILNLPPHGSEFAGLVGDILAERVKRVHPALA
jgi:hypothetical protein